MKRYILIFYFLILSACSFFSKGTSNLVCAQVVIDNNASYFTRTRGNTEDFRVELIGNESYCYNANDISRRYIVISPKFKITRLSSTDETRVDFSFYTETIKGPPEFIGKRSYFFTGNLDNSTKEITVTARPVKVKAPLNDPNFTVLLGLNLSDSEQTYNLRTFDTRGAVNKESASCAVSSGCGCGK